MHTHHCFLLQLLPASGDGFRVQSVLGTLLVAALQ